MDMDNNQSPDNIIENNNLSKKKQRKTDWLIRDIFEWGEIVISAVIIVAFLFTFVVRVTSVDGGSMMPTLLDKDQMLVTNLFYTPKHEDIVVVFAPNLECCHPTIGFCSKNCRDRGGKGKDIIKRVIGVEGDTIKIYGKADANGDGIVYRNGEPLSVDEDLVWGAWSEQGHTINSLTYVNGDTLEITVPPGRIFVLGDNRDWSIDSRYMDAETRQGSVGFVDINHVAGRAFFRVAPLYSFGFVK